MPIVLSRRPGGGGGASSGGLFDAVAILQDQQDNNTQSGTFTSGAWQTRVLNTKAYDPNNIVSLSSNQFTLAGGRSYMIIGRAPAWKSTRHQTKIRDITAGADAIIGASEYAAAPNDVQNDSWVVGVVSPAVDTAYELQHSCASSTPNQGFGVEANQGVDEIYAQVQIYRLAA